MQRNINSRSARARALATATLIAILAAGVASAAALVHGTVKTLLVKATGNTVTVTGTASVKPNTPAERRKARVTVQLNGVDHAYERKTLSLGSGDAYSATWRTRLTGKLQAVASVTIAGRQVGPAARGTVAIAEPVKTVTVTTPATSTPTTSSAYPGTALLGLFKLTAGSAPTGATPTGSYVEMLTANGGPLGNPTSPSPDKNYTPFTPGTDGGLSTVAYQPAPSPAFKDKTSGGALADEIVQPVAFEGTDFSIDTQATDVQTGQPDPLPAIYNSNGKLSGEITAWDAQWNGQSFNQGTPKPDGTSPSPTTPLSGTYDASTGAFVLTWRSRIVGGPFNGYSGYWHLSGTFVPASAGG